MRTEPIHPKPAALDIPFFWVGSTRTVDVWFDYRTNIVQPRYLTVTGPDWSKNAVWHYDEHDLDIARSVPEDEVDGVSELIRNHRFLIG